MTPNLHVCLHFLQAFVPYGKTNHATKRVNAADLALDIRDESMDSLDRHARFVTTPGNGSMTRQPMSPYRTLIDALQNAPIAIADGVAIVDQRLECRTTADGREELFGSLITRVWGHRVELRAVESHVFAGQFSEPQVDLGPLGSFLLSQLRVRITPPTTEKPIGFDISGRGKLDIRGIPALGEQTFVLEGTMVAVYSPITEATHLRLDLEPSQLDASFAGGVILSLSPERLFFLANDQDPVELEMRVSCTASGLPPFLQNAIGRDAFTADVHFSPAGLSLSVARVYERLGVHLPTFPPLGHLPPFDLGEIGLSVHQLQIDLGQDCHLRVDVQLQIPHALHSFMEPQCSFRVSATGTEIQWQWLTSPLRTLRLAPGAHRNNQAHLDLGEFGALSFTLPTFHLDWAKGTWVAEGLFSYRDLRLPLHPLLALLRAGGMDAWADRLPQSVVLHSFGWTGLAATLSDLVKQALGANVLAEKARDELHKLLERLELLPRRLQESFLHVELPTELAFRVELTADLGANIRIWPAPLPTKGDTNQTPQPVPFKLLVPLLGPHGPELLGLSLYHVAFAGLRAGQICTVEIDAEVDRFELVPIALSMTLAKENLFSRPDDVSQRFTCRNMTALLTFPGGTPLLVPTFFDALSFHHVGLDGLDVHAAWRFPAPKVDFGSLVPLVFGLHAMHSGGFMQGLPIPPDVHLELSAGPFGLRLPTYLGGGRIEWPQATWTVQSADVLTRLLAALRHLDIDVLLEMSFAAIHAPSIQLNLGSGFRKASRSWATIAEPALFVSGLSGTPKVHEGVVDKFNMWKGRLADGLSGITGDHDDLHVEARAARVTSQAIEFVVTLAGAQNEGPVEKTLALHWHNFVGSAAGLATKIRTA